MDIRRTSEQWLHAACWRLTELRGRQAFLAWRHQTQVEKAVKKMHEEAVSHLSVKLKRHALKAWNMAIAIQKELCQYKQIIETRHVWWCLSATFETWRAFVDMEVQLRKEYSEMQAEVEWEQDTTVNVFTQWKQRTQNGIELKRKYDQIVKNRLAVVAFNWRDIARSLRIRSDLCDQIIATRGQNLLKRVTLHWLDVVKDMHEEMHDLMTAASHYTTFLTLRTIRQWAINVTDMQELEMKAKEADFHSQTSLLSRGLRSWWCYYMRKVSSQVAR